MILAAASLPTTTDVLIVGAGVSGLCTARCLADAGREVVVVDRGDPWGDASGANAGTLSLQVKHPAVWKLSAHALRIWRALEAELEGGVGFAQPGGLRVAFDGRDRARLAAAYQHQRAEGLDVEWLDQAEVRDIAPWLGDGVVAATHCRDDAYAVPLVAGPALVRDVAERMPLVSGSAVTAISKRRAGFEVRCEDRRITCRALVVTAGAWSGELVAMLGGVLPVLADVNMLSVTEPAPRILDRIVTHVAGILSLKQLPNGTILIGGGWQGRGGVESGEKGLDHENLIHNLRVAAEVVPAIADLSLVRTWSGFEAVSPDALPMLGEIPGAEGAWICACARGGYTQGPALGQALAALIENDAVPVPVEAFSPARFAAR